MLSKKDYAIIRWAGYPAMSGYNLEEAPTASEALSVMERALPSPSPRLMIAVACMALYVASESNGEHLLYEFQDKERRKLGFTLDTMLHWEEELLPRSAIIQWKRNLFRPEDERKGLIPYYQGMRPYRLKRYLFDKTFLNKRWGVYGGKISYEDKFFKRYVIPEYS